MQHSLSVLAIALGLFLVQLLPLWATSSGSSQKQIVAVVLDGPFVPGHSRYRATLAKDSANTLMFVIEELSPADEESNAVVKSQRELKAIPTSIEKLCAAKKSSCEWIDKLRWDKEDLRYHIVLQKWQQKKARFLEKQRIPCRIKRAKTLNATVVCLASLGQRPKHNDWF